MNPSPFPEKIMPLKGEITVPGDKSISHRSVMFGSLSKGKTFITGFLDGADCRSTIAAFQKMGIAIEKDQNHVIVYGKGLEGLSQPSSALDMGNSGTTTRLISGILAGQSFTSHLTGDASIQKRPMGRIIDPLTQMGANISSDCGNQCAPLTIRPATLHGIHYQSPVASAQVKSCVLLAGLYAEGETTVTEPAISRDHTERILRSFGADIQSNAMEKSARIIGHPTLIGQSIQVPSDISSAAYFLAAGLITPNSEILLHNVNTNPTRAGILKVIQDMGGSIKYENQHIVSGEEVSDLIVRTSSLTGCTIEGDLIPTLIDEIPMIAVLAAFAQGTTYIRDAKELRVKESDRIQSITENLLAMGADITATEDGMIIRGGKPLHGASIQTHLDHRIAMAFTIAGLACDGAISLDHPDCVDISYPNFYEQVQSLIQE